MKHFSQMPEGTRHITINGAKLKRFVQLKKLIKEKLKDWQDEINKVSMDSAPIVVINDIDLECEFALSCLFNRPRHP